jgi:hypothetical protein
LEPDEIPLHRFRKASPFLLLRATVPALFFLLFVAFGLLLFERFGMVAPWWALWLLPGSGMAVTAALIGLVAWEWSASTLVVTNRSLIVRQIDLWAHRSDFQKIALERIREAIFSKQGWIDSVLGLVTVEIEGDSPQGRLLFGGLARQTSFLEAMFSVKSHVGEAMSRPVIRQALADRAGGARVPRLESPAQPRKPKGIQARKLSWRVEKDHQIWFRRHPWFLWKRGLPWLGWIALILFLGLVAAGFWPQGGWPITGVVVLAAVFPAARILWETADWAYDRLSIQGDKIMMVHRRPLWFGEIRQEGNLEQVEQVGVQKASLSALLFDFGTITISLGAGDPFLFEQAHHPEWVQNEIFHRRTLLRQNKESQAAKNRLDEVSEILDTWDEARRAGYFFKKESPENKEEI